MYHNRKLADLSLSLNWVHWFMIYTVNCHKNLLFFKLGLYFMENFPTGIYFNYPMVYRKYGYK